MRYERLKIVSDGAAGDCGSAEAIWRARWCSLHTQWVVASVQIAPAERWKALTALASARNLAPTTVGGTPTGPRQGPKGTLYVGSEAGTGEDLT